MANLIVTYYSMIPRIGWFLRPTGSNSGLLITKTFISHYLQALWQCRNTVNAYLNQKCVTQHQMNYHLFLQFKIKLRLFMELRLLRHIHIQAVVYYCSIVQQCLNRTNNLCSCVHTQLLALALAMKKMNFV